MVTKPIWGYNDPIVFTEPLDLTHIETEDDTPVDNLLSAKTQRLLVEPLYSSWTPPTGNGTFLADANVGVFYDLDESPLVPDVFLSVGIKTMGSWWNRRNRSYFYPTLGKPPDVVVEIVSNRRGGEDTHKLWMYAAVLNIPYYVIYDPYAYLGDEVLRVYEKHGDSYDELLDTWMPGIALGMTLWTGEYEGGYGPWLRWCDAEGTVIPTGREQAVMERQEKEKALFWANRERLEKLQTIQQLAKERQEKEQALSQRDREREEKEQALQEKEQALLRAEQLAAKLRELGIDI
jgi:Uma2 family endonuclease